MAQFKTAYLQRMVPFDVAVVGTINEGVEITTANRRAAILLNDFVVLTPASGTTPAYITKATQTQVDAKTATHIMALTDMTISDRKVPTDLKDYRISDLIGATTATAAATSRVKKVGLYPILDWNDIVQDADAMDALAATP